MKAQFTQHKNSKKLLLIILTGALIVLVASYFAYAAISKQAWPFQESKPQSQQTSEDNINYSPPTEQEIRDSQDGKKNSGEQENTASTGNVSVGISYAAYDDQEGVIDIRAFTPDIIEGNGTCTATLTFSNRTVERSSKAFIDSSSSQCEPIQISPDDFPISGIWELVVTYKSDTSKGQSTTVDVEVVR